MAGLLEPVRTRRTKSMVKALIAIVQEYVPTSHLLRHAA
jgi:hypothetical protein